MIEHYQLYLYEIVWKIVYYYQPTTSSIIYVTLEKKMIYIPFSQLYASLFSYIPYPNLILLPSPQARC